MLIDFFTTLRAAKLPVSVREYLTLLEALKAGVIGESVDDFYFLARTTLVKDEALFDKFDRAFSAYFKGVTLRADFSQEVPLEWLRKTLELELSPEEKAAIEKMGWDELMETLKKRFEEQKERHEGGSKMIGTGGTSPFGHSGFHPGGLRVGGESMNRSAVKVAGERRYHAYRADTVVGSRQFEVALRRLRRLSSRDETPPDELDLDATIQATADHAGALSLQWRRSRRNQTRVLLLMDAGGSMHAHLRICSQLFTAVNRATHFKDLRLYYFHNCVYDHLYLDPTCHPRNSVLTARVMQELSSEYKLVLVGDASMAPSELLDRDGIIWWGTVNEQPGIEWLRRLAHHFSHAAWLNPIPTAHWETIYGRHTIAMVRSAFPMFELTVDGLTQAVRSLVARR